MGFSVLATDGEIGRVNDLLFDDETWSTAYLVAKMRNLLKVREVLLPPTALGIPDEKRNGIPIAYTKEQVVRSPETDLDAPVSRQEQPELHTYVGWTPTWARNTAHGTGSSGELKEDDQYLPTEMPAEVDPHLHSAKDIRHYSIETLDAKMGRVEDLFVDEVTWTIRYIVVGTSAWFLGRKVLVSPRLIRNISWVNKKVHVESTIQMIQDCPTYEPLRTIDQQYLDELKGCRMITEIPAGEWTGFCQNFSKKHNGWLVTIESLKYDGEYRVVTREKEFDEISIHSRTVDAPVAQIEIGGVCPDRRTLIVPALSSMKAEYTLEGESKALEVHSENQGVTIIRFSSRREPQPSRYHRTNASYLDDSPQCRPTAAPVRKRAYGRRPRGT